MSGWAHRRTIDDGRVVAVMGAPTLLCSAETNSLVSASGVLVNLDSVDSVQVTWQTSWANTSATTTMRNPNLPLRVATWGATVRTPSMSHIRQGVDNTQGVRQTYSDTAKANASTEVVVFSLRNEDTFLSSPNTVIIAPDHLSVVHRGTAAQSVVLRLRRGCALTPASSWAAVSNSPASTDTTSTACASGRELMSFAADQGTHIFELRQYLLELYPGETLSVTALSVTGTPDLVVALSWRDMF